MKWLSLIFATCLACLVACDKAPDGIIKESKMEKLLIDLYKAEGYIAQHPEQFTSDSQKLVLKQSIYEKHHITQSVYDSSMVWYAMNIEAYNQVYKKVIQQLTDEQNRLMANANKIIEEGNGSQGGGTHKMLAATGDTANLWTKASHYMLTPVMGKGFLTFEMKPDKAYQMGDRYQLNLKMLTFSNNFGMFMAVDYIDGSTSFVSRSTSPTGWITLDLQSDSLRRVNRIYGYIRYDVKRNSIVFLDSIQVLRTHLNKDNYGYIRAQKFLTHDKNAVIPGKTSASKPALAHPVQEMSGFHKNIPSFRPKPGVNKGGHVPAH